MKVDVGRDGSVAAGLGRAAAARLSVRAGEALVVSHPRIAGPTVTVLGRHQHVRRPGALRRETGPGRGCSRRGRTSSASRSRMRRWC